MKRNFKSNTTSTILIDSTVENPNIRALIRSIATSLHADLLEDICLGKSVPVEGSLYHFNEEKYIKESPDDFDAARIEILKKTPMENEIAEFIEVKCSLNQALYNVAMFSQECCIISLVYLNRLFEQSSMPALPLTWRPLIFTSLLVSQKVWDDGCLTNSDFYSIYPFFTIDQINNLEMVFLQLINYNTYIKFSLYAKYYFELKTLQPTLQMKPLSKLVVSKWNHLKEVEEALKKKYKTTAHEYEEGTPYVIS